MSDMKPNDLAPTKDRNEEQDLAAAKALVGRPTPLNTSSAITIAVSSCALFNLEEEEGDDQVEHENVPLQPGPAFHLVKALMTVNSRLKELYPDSEELFDIVLLPNNQGQAGARLRNSIDHFGLRLALREDFCMTDDQSLIDYLKTSNTNLYLSKDSEKVRKAIEGGIAAATMFTQDVDSQLSDTQLRVVFDGDGVLFSDESEIVMRTQGLEAFIQHERESENRHLPEGPLKCFLEALGKLQSKFHDNCPIQTFLVTARGTESCKERVLKTLHSWGLKTDGYHFLTGKPKGPVLQEIKPHIYFDDQTRHIDDAKQLGIISAHVPYGIANGY